MNTSVVNSQNHIDILHRLRSDIGKLLDLGSSILDLIISHLEVELIDSRSDSVPSSQSVTTISHLPLKTRHARLWLLNAGAEKRFNPPNRDITGHSKVGRVENLISRWVGKDGLGMDTGLVCECTESSDVVVAADQYRSYIITWAVSDKRKTHASGYRHRGWRIEQVKKSRGYI